MKTEYRIYVALAIAAVVFGGYYLVRKDEHAELAARTSTATAAADAPAIALPEADVGAITKIQIKNADKSDVTLEKAGDAWEVTAPVKAAANQKNVEQLLDNLKALKAGEVIDRTAASYEQYELDDAKALHFVAYKGADKALDLYFGKSGTRGQMVRVAGTDGVWIADGYSGFLYTREVKNWRETELLKFEDKNAIQVAVENKHGKFSFSKNGEEWSGSYQKRAEDGSLEAAAKSWPEFDSKKVGDLLRAFKGLRATDFAADGDDTGVDDPINNGGIVHIALQDNAGEYTIKVGKAQKAQNRYAVKDGDPTVVVLSSWSAEWAVGEKSKFETEMKDEEKAGADKDDKKGDADKKGDKKDAAPKKDAPPKKDPPKAPPATPAGDPQ